MIFGFGKNKEKKPEPEKHLPEQKDSNKNERSNSLVTSYPIEGRQFLQMNPIEWNKKEVAAWIEYIGFTDVADHFEENCISGKDLKEIAEEDLKQMWVKKIGDRKKILQHIAELFKKEDKGVDLEDNSDSSDIDKTPSTEEVSEERSDHSSSHQKTIPIKCFLPTDEIVIIDIPPPNSVEELRQQIFEHFKMEYGIKYVDDEGDQIVMVTNTDLSRFLSYAKNSKLRLWLVAPLSK